MTLILNDGEGVGMVGKVGTLGGVSVLGLLLMLAMAVPCAAQKFSVISVSQQANDVSAFISPVRDLNGQACALVKVEAPSEFVFSTPLGIVKRVDEVGEIWLYLPGGTKQITLKHPEWGVLRNYRFKSALESHVCYVMKVRCPEPEVKEVHDTVVFTQTVRDTVAVRYRRPPLPWSNYIMATMSLHKGGPSFGLFLATMKRHGLFAHVSSDFRSIGSTDIEVDADGYVDGSDVMPFYNGKKRHANFKITAGLTHRVGKHINIFEGAGYGKTSTAWQLDESEGGGWALCGDHSHKGVAMEAGVMWHNDKVSALVSASNIRLKQWQVNIGIGIRIGKSRKVRKE